MSSNAPVKEEPDEQDLEDRSGSESPDSREIPLYMMTPKVELQEYTSTDNIPSEADALAAYSGNGLALPGLDLRVHNASTSSQGSAAEEGTSNGDGELKMDRNSHIEVPEIDTRSDLSNFADMENTNINPLLRTLNFFSNDSYSNILQISNFKEQLQLLNEARKSNYLPPHDADEMLLETTMQRFACNVCDTTFNERTLLALHVIMHADERPYVCNHCYHCYPTPQKLSRHEIMHTERRHECEFCLDKFHYKHQLGLHMRVHTGERPYECLTCQKQFLRRASLDLHARTHTGEKPYECPTCQKTFTQSSILSRHLRTHTGEKPFKCSVCFRHFSYSAGLTEHMRTHTGEKPFKCTICSRHFTHSNTLKEHMRTHTGETPYTCPTCDKQFTQSSSLSKHLRIHTGEKPFKCPTCLKRFTQNSSLSKHLVIHTGLKPFKCQVCGKQFSRNTHLTRHSSRMHPAEKILGA